MFITILQDIVRNNSGVISTAEAEHHGISRAMLSYLCAQGKLDRIAKGFYSFPDTIPDELYVLSRCSANIVFSHETALFLHGLSERTPCYHSFSLQHDKRLSSQLSKDAKIHYVKNEYWGIGQEQVRTTFGNLVTCYDKERTICDIIRSRNKLDPEVYISAIKLYGTSKERNLSRLSNYALQMNMADKVRHALEVLI